MLQRFVFFFPVLKRDFGFEEREFEKREIQMAARALEIDKKGR